MKITFSNENKKENKDLKLFLDSYLKRLKKVELMITCVVEGATKSPDFLVPDASLAVEVKEVHDLAENKEHAQWGRIINNLQRAIEKNPLFRQVRGSFMLETPPNFKMRKDLKGIELNALKIIQRILNGDKTFVVDKVTFEAIKISDKDNGIFFGTSRGGSYDPAGTIHQNTFKQINSANIQLSNSPSGYKRVVLLVNKYQKVHWDWDIFKALSYMFSELRSYTNIDEIWFQNQLQSGKTLHKLIYRKDIFDQLESKKITKYEEIDQELFANWFSSLETLGEDKKEELLEGLKILLKDKTPDQVFKDPVARGEIARFGMWIVDKGLFDDAVWFVEKFINDSDPPEPKEEEKESEGLNYHNQILSGKNDVYAITSVLGHLAWVIQKLTVHKETLLKSFEFTKELLRHKNLYIKLQAMIPLIEITRRREIIQKKDLKIYDDFHELLFTLLDNYSKYPALARGLVQVFYHYKDLNTEDALRVVKNLKYCNESAPIIIFYALFRVRHFKEKGKFDQSPLLKELEEIIKFDDKEFNALRDSVLWNFWKLLQTEPGEFLVLKPYIDMFFLGNYSNRATHTLELIIEEWLEREPKVCTTWFSELVKKAVQHVGDNQDKGREVWFDTEKSVAYISKEKPEELLSIMENLVKLWKSYAYVGNPKELLESYKNIKNRYLKEKIKKQFKIWYNEMNELNPKIYTADWNL